MLLKKTDDKSERVAFLEELQQSAVLTAAQKQWAADELARLRLGLQGERESAYFLDQYFKDSANHVVLHDLRLVVEGDVAQIDHLVISRGLGLYLIETKNYSGNVVINGQGEFTVEYGRKRMGVESPIEQSRRHERVLLKLLDRLDIKARTGAPLQCHHVVMFHPKAIITRPPSQVFDTRHVIKADQFPSWHASFVDAEWGVGTFLKVATNLRSLETIKEWGEKLMRQHRPAPLPEQPEAIKPAAARAPDAAAAETANSAPCEKRLLCLQCRAKISYAEGRFCWNNPQRFGGGQYCRAHQGNFQ